MNLLRTGPAEQHMQRVRLCIVLVFAGLVFLLTGLTGPTGGNTAFAQGVSQVTSTARLEIGGTGDRFYIGPETYVTEDKEGTLTGPVVATRHQNNLRGQRQSKPVINPGIAASPLWLVFSVTNSSDISRWVLDFGDVFSGRMALAKKISVYNHTTGEFITRALREDGKKGAYGEAFHGSALPLTIRENQTELFVVYLDVEGGLPNTIAPYLITEKNYIEDIRSGDLVSGLFYIFLLALMVLFCVLAFVRRKTGYATMALYFLVNALLFYILDHSFFAPYTLTGEGMIVLYALTSLAGLVMTKFFFDFTIDNYNENTILLVTGAFVVVLTLLNIVLFGESSFFDDVLVFVPAFFVAAIICTISFVQGWRGKESGYALAAGWLFLLAGTCLTAAAASGLLPASAFSLNSYWGLLVVQGTFCVAAAFKKIEEEEEEKRQLLSRENRAARSLDRLKHSKESADQARLLRVIERERELMGELREREIQRTEEMRRAKDMADEANRAKSAFLAVVSHEIRTPMTGILGMVRLLTDTKLSKEQFDYAQAIQKSGDTMMALLNDILDFEKIESGNMDLEEISFDLVKLIQGIVTLMSGHAANKGVTLKSGIPDDFPRYVVGDPTRLRQVLLNLVNNAIKFTDKGSVTIEIASFPLDEVEGAPVDGRKVEFAVVDTGIGISEEAQKSLFDPFSQADSSVSRKYGGTGLGLAICKRLVGAMGGRIEVKSTEGEGSRFFFTIVMPEGTSVEEDGQDTRSSVQEKLSPLHILVVEDNEMNQKVLDAFLTKEGHSAVLTNNAEEALKLLQKDSFDAVFMDINLSSGMDGGEATGRIRAMKDPALAQIPVIAITGNVSEEDIQEYSVQGFTGFIPKPIDPDVLYEVLVTVHDDKKKRGEITSLEEADSSDSTGLSLENGENRENGETVQEFSSFDGAVSSFKIQTVREIKPSVQDDGNTPPSPSDPRQDVTQESGDENGGDDQSPLDMETLKSLRNNLETEQYDQLIRGFIKTTDEIIESLQYRKDIEFIIDRAHELKGMAANFGFAELSDVAAAIETAAKKHDTDAVFNELPKLSKINEKAQKALDKWEKSHEKPSV